MAIGEVAEPPLAWFTRPARGGGFAVIGAISEEEVNALLVERGRVLFVGDEEAADAASDGVLRVDDLHSESLQWAVADVAASDEVEIRTVVGIEPHRIMEVEEPSAPLDERDHRALLLGRHPGEMRGRVALRALKAVTKDDQEPDPGEVFRRQRVNVHREVRNDTRRLEDGS